MYKIPINSNIFYDKKNIFNRFINPILPDIKYPSLDNKKTYTTSASTLTKKDIYMLLQNIDYNKSTNKYIEHKQNTTTIYNNKSYKLDHTRMYNCLEYITNILINQFKKEIKKNLTKYYCPKYKYCIPSIINRSVIRIENSVDTNDIRYHFSVEILVNNKAHSHIFYIILESIGNKRYINTVKFIGIQFSDLLMDNISGFDKEDKHINIYTNLLTTPYNTDKDYYRVSDLEPIQFNQKDIQRILNNKKCGVKCEKNNYKCYGKDAFDILKCEMPVSYTNQKANKGKWDRLCKKNSECPFYRKNKNYPNNRGGCISGWCEMPVGIKQVSPRFAEKKTSAYCYNCKKDTNTCCSEQKNYKNTSSPDYIFKDDFIKRYKYKKLFDSKGLNVY